MAWTNRVENDNGERSSIWEGTNENGEQVRVYVRRITVITDENKDGEEAEARQYTP